MVAGVSLATAASVSWLSIALLAVAVLGVCTGTVYVLGFTLLHQNVTDELRGRIFSALYTLVRLCVLIAFAVGPLLSGLLGSVSESLLDDSRFEIGGVSVFVPGVRLTLWLAAAIILGAVGPGHPLAAFGDDPARCHRRSAAACPRRAARRADV